MIIAISDTICHGENIKTQSQQAPVIKTCQLPDKENNNFDFLVVKRITIEKVT